jgi:protein FrlC
MKISTSTSLLVNYLLEDAVDEVISTGFEGIDVWCGRPHLYRHDYSEEYIKALGGKIAASGLTVTSVMPAFFRYPYSIASPLKVICDDSVRYMFDCIDNAKLLGAESVLVVPINNVFSQSIEETRKVFINSLAVICEYAESKNISLNIEVLYSKLSGFVCETKQAVQIIREIGSNCLGIVLDTGHLNLSGENIESALETAGDLLKQVHINDNTGKDQQNAVPGEGDFDFSQFIRLLNNNDYKGFLSLELGWHYSFDPVPVMAKAIEVTKNYLLKG